MRCSEGGNVPVVKLTATARPQPRLFITHNMKLQKGRRYYHPQNIFFNPFAYIFEAKD